LQRGKELRLRQRLSVQALRAIAPLQNTNMEAIGFASDYIEIGLLVWRLWFPREKSGRQGTLENIQDALTSLLPGLLVKLDTVANDQIFQTVGARSGQLLVVLLNAPEKLKIQLLQQ